MTSTSDTSASAPPTRRERLRAALTTEIKDCAWRQLDNGGVAAVTLRGIAREIGVSPAALYGYFDSLDALFDALMTDGYNELADAIAAAVGTPGDFATRMLAGVQAFRRWALDRPERFRLLYLTRVPGFEHAVDTPALTASLRVFVPMLGLMVDAWASGA